jgi:hypothetical protein
LLTSSPPILGLLPPCLPCLFGFSAPLSLSSQAGSRYIERSSGDRRAAAASSCDGSDPGGGAVRAVVRITRRLGMDYFLLISTLYLFAIFLSFPISNFQWMEQQQKGKNSSGSWSLLFHTSMRGIR